MKIINYLSSILDCAFLYPQVRHCSFIPLIGKCGKNSVLGFKGHARGARQVRVELKFDSRPPGNKKCLSKCTQIVFFFSFFFCDFYGTFTNISNSLLPKWIILKDFKIVEEMLPNVGEKCSTRFIRVISTGGLSVTVDFPESECGSQDFPDLSNTFMPVLPS